MTLCAVSSALQGRGQGRGGGECGRKEVGSVKRMLTRDTVLTLSMKLLPEEALHRVTGRSSAGHSLLQRHDVNWAAGGNGEEVLLVPLI